MSSLVVFDFDETLDKIIAAAAKFNVDRVKQEDVAKSGGGEAIDDGQTNLRGAAEEDGSLGLSEGVTHDGVLSR